MTNGFHQRAIGLLAVWTFLVLMTGMLIFSPALLVFFWWIAPLTLVYTVLSLVTLFVLIAPFTGLPGPASPAPTTTTPNPPPI